MRNLRYFLVFLILSVLTGCANQNAPSQESIEAQGIKYDEMSKSHAFNIQDAPYLGSKLVPLDENNALLDMLVVLRKRDTFSNIGTAISDIAQVSVYISESDVLENDVEPQQKPQGLPPSSPLDLSLDMPLPTSGNNSKMLSINYEGTLKGLLEQIAMQSGYGWDYNAKSNTIVFAKMMVRTFSILAAPGEVSYESQITNKSKESDGGGLGMGQGVSVADTSVQTSQTNKSTLKTDVWKETTIGITSLLSKQGTVSSNPSSGTITVKDRPENIRRVTAFMKDINLRVSRQVALKVQVWALEISDENEAGINLQMLFNNENLALVAGNLATLGQASTASASIISGDLKDSTAILKALKQWGNATQVTSGGGLVMNNHAMPIMATVRNSYLASVSSVISDYGQTTEITPGEVTTGFSMTVVPHILDRRRVVLQYNINLSSLDDMAEYSTGETKVQLPKVSTRAFSQRSIMRMGQTLVLAGFQQEIQSRDNSIGLLNLGRSAGYIKTLLVITIELESAGEGMES